MKKYTQEHEWMVLDEQIATVGITDHVQKELGDIVYVELPLQGHHVQQGDEAVILESTKAAVDIYTPLSGEIIEVNTSLRQFPEKVNEAAETEGWLFKIKINNNTEIDSLMDEKEYKRYVKDFFRRK